MEDGCGGTYLIVYTGISSGGEGEAAMSTIDRHNLQRFRRYSGKLNRMIENGSLESLPENKRSRLVGRVRKLYRSLMGVVPDAVLMGILASATAIVLGITGCDSGGGGGGEFVRFAAPVENPFGLAPDTYHCFMALADIDADGDVDIFMIGESGLDFFENTGSAGSPSFAAPVNNPFGITPIDYIYPTLADIDGDGDMDLFHMGYNYSDYTGSLHYYENTGTPTSPSFAAGVEDAFGVTAAYMEAFIDFADIDGDGDLDLFGYSYDYYGDTEGVVFIENTGSPTAPALGASPVAAPFGMGPIPEMAARSQFALGDVDGDGDLDLMMGGYGGYGYYYTPTAAGFYYFENTGSPTAPSFGAPSSNPFSLVGIDSYMSYPNLADLDADGDLDLVVGSPGGYDYSTYSYTSGAVYYYENLLM
jgi:hypothetical protein